MWTWKAIAARGPLRRPTTLRHWLVLAPMLIISFVVGVASAVVSAFFWLPVLLIALAPVALAASCWAMP